MNDRLRQRVQALYHSVPVTPENTRDVRGLAWGLLADVLISDYLNRWNEAGNDAAGANQLLVEAETAADKALKIDPDFALAHYAKGLIHRAKGHSDLAIRSFDEAIRCDPNFARAYAQKASELINQGQAAQVLSLLDEALRRGPKDKSLGMFHWNVGRFHFFNNDYAKAIPALEKARQLRPNLWHNWLYLASAQALSGNEIEARKVLAQFGARQQFRNSKFTRSRVKSYEKANPANSALVRDGRLKFHEGLRLAGMKAR